MASLETVFTCMCTVTREISDLIKETPIRSLGVRELEGMEICKTVLKKAVPWSRGDTRWGASLDREIGVWGITGQNEALQVARGAGEALKSTRI